MAFNIIQLEAVTTHSCEVREIEHLQTQKGYGKEFLAMLKKV